MDLIIRDETARVVSSLQRQTPPDSSPEPAVPAPGGHRRSRSVDIDGYRHVSERTGLESYEPRYGPSSRFMGSRPWLKQQPSGATSTAEEMAVEAFFDKYVVYPCSHSSSHGFLEHLPVSFKEVNVDGRCALRWAVIAAGLADASRTGDETLARKAFECYGQALTALGRSLREKGKAPDDYDLMTVVVLDIFEVGYDGGCI